MYGQPPTRKYAEPGGIYDTREQVPRGVARARAKQEGDPIFIQALAILERDRSGAPLGLPRLPTQALPPPTEGTKLSS